jgi:DNA-binding IclR family transcriptional regulator
VGEALLSTLPCARRRAYLEESGLRPFTAQTIRAVEDLEADLRDAADGVLAEVAQYQEDVACLAVLADSGDADGPSCALALGGAAASFAALRRHLTVLLRPAAGDLSAQPS